MNDNASCSRKRLDGWQTRFWTAMREAQTRPFVWGTRDCVMFATSMIDVVLGTDYYAQAKIRYPYSTEAEAAALMTQHGGITGLVASFLGEPTNWGRLGIGDIVLASTPEVGDVLCIHDGTNILAPGKLGGFERVPFRYAMHGWRIG